MKRFIVTLLISLLMAGQAWGATYYTKEDGSAVNKEAATSCADAMSVATYNAETFSAGDIICVCPDGGEITTTITSHLGSDGSRIVLRGDCDGDGSRSIVNPSSGDDGITITHQYFDLEDLDIRGSNVTFSVVRIAGASAGDNDIKRCLIHETPEAGTHNGVHVNNAAITNIGIIDSEIYNIRTEGVDYQGGNGLEINNVYIHDFDQEASGGDGIQLSTNITDDILINNSRIYHPGSGIKNGLILNNTGTAATNINITNNEFKTIGTAKIAILCNTGGANISGNTFSNVSRALSLGSSGGTTTFTRNIHSDGEYTVYLGAVAGNLLATNNTSSGITVETYHLGGTGTATIQNNISQITAAGDIHVLKAAAQTLVASNNLYYPEQSGAWRYNGTLYDTLATWQSASSVDANSINLDPLFKNPTAGDFRLQLNSPAIRTAAGTIEDGTNCSMGANQITLGVGDDMMSGYLPLGSDEAVCTIP